MRLNDRFDEHPDSYMAAGAVPVSAAATAAASGAFDGAGHHQLRHCHWHKPAGEGYYMDELPAAGAEQYHFIMAIAMCGQAVHEQHRQGCLSGVAHSNAK